MNRIILVGISTILRFSGQFLFIKSISHLSEQLILETLNLQSLSVLLAGFSSGGIQTYLAKNISLDKVESAWKSSIKETSKLFLYSLIIILPLYLMINKTHSSFITNFGIVILSFFLSFSNNWQGLLTGQKKYVSILSVFLIQFLFFLIQFLLGEKIPENFFLISYPSAIILSFLITYFINRPASWSLENKFYTHDVIKEELSSYRVMGIVLMTAGVAYPFLTRNILSLSFPIEVVINWDYLMRISTAYTSVSTFFIFTLFASDMSLDNKKLKHFLFFASTLLFSYTFVFYFFNPILLKLLLSRDIILSLQELNSFILFEILRSVFSLFCIYSIIKGHNKFYICLETFNLVISSILLYLLSPKSLSEGFLILTGCLSLAAIFAVAIKKVSQND